MKISRKSILLKALVILLPAIANAQEAEQRPDIEVASMFSTGGLNVLDTYLSPEKYRGVEWRFTSEVMRDSRKRPVTYLMTHEGAFGYTHNRSKTGNELTGHYNFSYGAMYRWRLLEERLTLRAGAMATADVGFAYNNRTSANNPAQGYGSLAIGPELMAQYRFTLWGKEMRVGYEMRMPWLGIMFSPNYGQSYYEIFNRGDSDHNIVFTSLATFQIRQQLSLDIFLSKNTALRIGYLSDIRQAKPNNLKQHQYYNAGTIGLVISK